jgi:aminoglycoside 3-N-acetyltransferase
MFTKTMLIDQLKESGIKQNDTLLVHSSMRAIGDVEGRADTVIDVLMEYLTDGLLILPTHTWAQMGEDYLLFDPKIERACVGILPNIFMKRKNVVRSLHPTHSVAAYGNKANEYIDGDENWDTPCAKGGCWGKLYDMDAKILFIGVGMERNTFIHSVEEWVNVPNRLSDKRVPFQVKKDQNCIIERPAYRHYHPNGSTSDYYVKLQQPFLETGVIKRMKFGEASCFVGKAKEMANMTLQFLENDLDVFGHLDPIPSSWYK